MREFILQFGSTYFAIIVMIVALVPPWILYLPKFSPLVEVKKEVWLNDFIPFVWMVFIPNFSMIYLYPELFIYWLVGTVFISLIIYMIPKPISIMKRIYWCLYVYNSSEADRKKWENSFIRKFIICHFWSSWIFLIYIGIKSLI